MPLNYSHELGNVQAALDAITAAKGASNPPIMMSDEGALQVSALEAVVRGMILLAATTQEASERTEVALREHANTLTNNWYLNHPQVVVQHVDPFPTKLDVNVVGLPVEEDEEASDGE